MEVQQAPVERPNRRFSVSTRDSSDQSGGLNPAPPLSLAHRRMSRMDRRMSTFRRMSLAGSQRTELSTDKARPMKLQNTYRMEPGPGEKFKPDKVEKVMQSVMENYLADEEYEAKKCAAMVKSVADMIKSRVKDMDFPRYKIACHVVIGQNTKKSLQYSSRCLWNTDTDSCANAIYTNSSLYATATVYAVYFE